MKNRNFLSTIALGLGLTVVLLLLLARPTPVARADPGIYYVREGGASTTCITITDPCGSVQQAINLATLSGDEVWVATGAYTENLGIVHGVKLRGGWNVSFTVQAPATYPAIIDGSGAHVITAAVETGSVLIEGFTVQNGRDGIHLYTGTITMTQNIVRDATRQGIEIEDGHILLEDNLITDIDREGIEIDGGAVTVRSNRVYTVGRHGILVEGGTTLIEGNIVRAVTEDPDNDYHGIEITGTQVVSGNQVSDIDDRGIFAHDGAYVIVNNSVHDTGGDGIRTAGSSTQVEIRNNTVRGAGNDGIDARGDVIAVTHNTVSGCADNGIRAEADESVHIGANWVLSNATIGIAIRQAPVFTLTNNVVGDHPEGSVELQDTGAGFLYHNTLVGSGTGAQGIGIAILDPLTATLVNNIVVSHTVGITATAGATLFASNTLLWANGDDPISGTIVLPYPPLFVDPARQDYHILTNSPAVDAGMDIGVTSDVDGDPRPIGDSPDIGADEVWFKVYLPLTLRSYRGTVVLP